MDIFYFSNMNETITYNIINFSILYVMTFSKHVVRRLVLRYLFKLQNYLLCFMVNYKLNLKVNNNNMIKAILQEVKGTE